MKSGIYQIRNKVNGKRYIGSAVNFSKRWSRHRCNLRDGNHANAHLQAAWNKYGAEAFEFTILALAPRETLLDVEQQHLDVLAPEYNVAVSATAPMLGRSPSLETRAKLSATSSGRKHTPEAIAKCVAAKLGKRPSPETRAKMRASALKRGYSLNAILAMTAANKGRKRSAEIIEKSAAKHRGRKHSIESRARMSAAARNRGTKCIATMQY